MSNSTLDFNTEFSCDTEVDAALESLISAIGKKMEESDRRASIVVPNKIEQVLYTYKLLKYVTKNTDARVTYELYQPCKSMGSVSVTGSNINFTNTEWFIKSAELASNIDIYPRTNGKVTIDFTFHGLTKNFE